MINATVQASCATTTCVDTTAGDGVPWGVWLGVAIVGVIVLASVVILVRRGR